MERPTKKPKAKKPPTKKAAAMCPAELKDRHQRDENDRQGVQLERWMQGKSS